MLIDDDKIDVFISQRVIGKYDSNLKTRAFNNASSALNFIKLLELNTNIKSLVLPDVILLDVNMPEMDGFSFLRELKTLEFFKIHKPKVFMLSSSLCPEDISKAQKEADCSGYVTKPLTVDKLMNVLKPLSLEEPQHFKKII